MLALAAGALLLAGPFAVRAASGEARELPASEAPGLPVGAKAPDFTLRDQNGNPVSLHETLKRGPVALVFYRSADW